MSYADRTVERLHRKYHHIYSFRKADKVKFAVCKYIHFYNHQRFQKKLNNLRPYKYRTQVV
nr:IS3 family transposase [Bacillus cereus]